ncbi:MAG TPA: CDP-alcohol phosphatidyltransferase family protein [Euzebyales bacterium]|nr:CDP-alcohol phosphatidyltransferase family protein [Euzebyales bacterium]
MPLFDAGRRPDAGGELVHDRLLTAPNLITAVRLAGLPLFAWLVLWREQYLAAFWVLVAIATTDWIDGYVARRFNQVSRIGKLVDPLVDRLLLATTTITLLLAGLLPWPLLALILVRDVVVLGVSLAWFGGVPPIPVSRTGKLATALLMIGIPAFLLAGVDWADADVVRVFAWITTVAGITAYYTAAARYCRVALAIRRARTD